MATPISRTDDHCKVDIPMEIHHQNAGDRADETHGGAYGKVDVAAGLDAKQHADRKDDGRRNSA
jgi:hypothetical protein